jgi:hypothetical protein
MRCSSLSSTTRNTWNQQNTQAWNIYDNHISNDEIKSVECIVEKDFARKVKNYFYEGVLYDTVPMTQADFQTDLTID